MSRLRGAFDGLARWRATLFLAGGVMLLPFAASLALIGVLGWAEETYYGYRVFSGAGFGLGFLGLLGLYPSVSRERPGLARAGALFAVLGAVMFATSFVTAGLPGVAFLFGAARPLALLNFAAVLVAYPCFGLAVLSSGAGSRRLGLLLTLPAVLIATNFVRGIVAGGNWAVPELVVALGAAQAATLLAIGYTLGSEDGPERPTGVHAGAGT